MGYEVPDLVIYQVRWFDSSEYSVTYCRWTPWKNVEDWEYKDALAYIERGYKYQVRILKQISIKGFGINESDEPIEIEVNPGY